MKHFIYIFFIFVACIGTTNAQEKNKAEHFKALKVGYITQTLELTPEEAEDFWPIYNKHQGRIYKLRFKETKELRKKLKEENAFESLSDSEAQEILNQFLNIDLEILTEQKNMYEELKSVLSAKKILRLHQAEHDFNKKMLRQLKSRRENSKEK